MDTLPANDATSGDPPRADAARELVLGTGSAPSRDASERSNSQLTEELRHELWLKSGAEALQLTETEFGAALEAIAVRYNFGHAPNQPAKPSEQESFWRSLYLEDLALARACALGREIAWQRFMTHFRGPLVRIAQGLTRSAGLGEELADALYGELFGFGERAGTRSSPLHRYSGRGSLLSWLRALMSQQLVNQYRSTHRETPLEDLEPPAPESPEAEPESVACLREALPIALAELSAEERFLLSAYYLDGHSLKDIGRVLGVHEATISRKLKRSTKLVRKALLKALVTGGLSRRAAEEALRTDPGDVDLNLRKLLQDPSDKTYSLMEGQA